MYLNLIGQQSVNGAALESCICYGLRVKMPIYQLFRYFVAFFIDSISNGYTLITIHELKPWVFFAFKENYKSSPITHLNLAIPGLAGENFLLCVFVVQINDRIGARRHKLVARTVEGRVQSLTTILVYSEDTLP